MYAICYRQGPHGSIRMDWRVYDDREKAETARRSQYDAHARNGGNAWVIYFEDPRL